MRTRPSVTRASPLCAAGSRRATAICPRHGTRCGRSCRRPNGPAATGRCGRAGTGCSFKSARPSAMTPSPPPVSTSPRRTRPPTPAWPASKASPSTCADWADATWTSWPRRQEFSVAARGQSCAPSAPNPTDARCSPPAAAPKRSRSSTGPGTNTTRWEHGPSAATYSALCARPAPAAPNGPPRTPGRRPAGLASRTPSGASPASSARDTPTSPRPPPWASPLTPWVPTSARYSRNSACNPACNWLTSWPRSARGKPREVHPRIDSELLEDVPEMRIDRVLGDEELVGDLPVGAAVRGQVGDHGLGFGQCLPAGLRPVDPDQTPSHAETAKPAPNAGHVPARPGARRNRQRLVERGDRRRAVAALRQHPAEVFERGRVGQRARSAPVERNRALEVLRGIAPDASGVRRGRGARTDLRIEARAAFGDRDGLSGQFLVTDRGGDADAFGGVGDLVRGQRGNRSPV